ncbi:unnamed protein product [Rodentolepis nana]|uniref:Protein kinase domain-containing protein n=1 Tax=Rodentolepis nana TaxID=102285 RepID=A0A0R3TD81_RODNA|nr:unnamed protein product [Rodentolepis nana]
MDTRLLGSPIGRPPGNCGSVDATSMMASLPLSGHRIGAPETPQVYKKPLKILSIRYLLGGTIGRGSYGKVRRILAPAF